MKKLDEVLENFKPNTIDNRDAHRLADFTPEDKLPLLGVKLLEKNIGTHVPIAWNEENILAQLKKDVAFGFEKALDQRGLSAGMMYQVVGMWNEILENNLNKSDEDYSMYGLPRLKTTALHYGWENPIGEDEGSEESYNE